jgi:hypothetical protein
MISDCYTLHKIQMLKADMKNIDDLNGVLGLLVSLIIINLWLTSLIFLLLTKISNLTFFCDCCFNFSENIFSNWVVHYGS